MAETEGSFISGVGLPMERCNAQSDPVEANAAALALFEESSPEALCARLRDMDTESGAVHDLQVGRIFVSRVVVDQLHILQCALLDDVPRDATPPLLRLYAEAFRASPTPTMVADRRGRMPIDVNPAWLNLLGYTRAQVDHVGAHDIWAFPDDRRQYFDAVTANQGEANGFETSLRAKSGEVIPVQIFSRLIDKANPDFAVTVLVDLRERRRYEADLLAEGRRLRTSQSKLDAIFRDSPTPTLIFYPAERRVVEMNGAMEVLSGYTLESAAEVDLDRFWVDPDVRAEYVRRATQKRIDRFPATIRRSDGQPIRVLLYRGVIESGEGELSVIQMVDVSALHESEERFERLFRHTPTPTILLTLSSDVLDANVAAERLFGIDRGDDAQRTEPAVGRSRRAGSLHTRDRPVRACERLPRRVLQRQRRHGFDQRVRADCQLSGYSGAPDAVRRTSRQRVGRAGAHRRARTARAGSGDCPDGQFHLGPQR